MKEALYLPHDINSRRDPKILRLRSKYGAAGYGVYWAIVEVIVENGGSIAERDIAGVAYELQVEESLVSSIFSEFDLFEFQDGNYTTKRIQKHLQRMNEISEKRREIGRIGGKARSSKAQANAKQLLDKSQAKAKQIQANKIKLNKIKLNTDRTLDQRIEENLTVDDLTVSIDNNSTIVESGKPEGQYGNKQLNAMLTALRLKVGVKSFVDSGIERLIGMHCLNLMNKIGAKEFGRRLDIILQDSFHAKNSNKIKYIYGQLKGFIEPKTTHIS